jgi:hypothetical protein
VRTTLDIDDAVLEQARTLARRERKPLGAVISELARRGLTPGDWEIAEEHGIPVFRVAAGVPPITSEQVRAALEEP